MTQLLMLTQDKNDRVYII